MCVIAKTKMFKFLKILNYKSRNNTIRIYNDCHDGAGVRVVSKENLLPEVQS